MKVEDWDVIVNSPRFPTVKAEASSGMSNESDNVPEQSASKTDLRSVRTNFFNQFGITPKRVHIQSSRIYFSKFVKSK